MGGFAVYVMLSMSRSFLLCTDAEQNGKLKIWVPGKLTWMRSNNVQSLKLEL